MRRPALLVAVAVALLLAGCGADADEIASPSSSPTTTAVEASPSPTAGGDGTPGVIDDGGLMPSPTATATDEQPAGAGADDVTDVALPTDVFPLGLSPDGTAVLVARPDPDGVRCEESTPFALGRFDVASGALVDATSDGSTVPPFTIDPRGDGTAIGYDGCEGVIGAVVLLDLADDGTVTVRREVADDVVAQGVTAVAAIPGRDRVALSRVTGPGTAQLLVTDLAGTLVGDPVPMLSETYSLTAAADGRVFAPTFREGTPEVQEVTEGVPFPGYESVGRDAGGTTVVLAGDRGVAVVEPGVRLDEWLVDPVDGGVRYLTPTLVGDGRVVVTREDADAGTTDLVAVDADGAVEVLAVDVLSVLGPTVDRAGERVLVARFADDAVVTGLLELS